MATDVYELPGRPLSELTEEEFQLVYKTNLERRTKNGYKHPKITKEDAQRDLDERIQQVRQLDNKYIEMGNMPPQPEEFYQKLRLSFSRLIQLQYEVV
jgi:hypothetical protein